MPSDPTAWARGVCRAKFLIFSRTMLIPRSSDALSSKTRERKLSGLIVRVRRRHGHGANGQRTRRVVVLELRLWMFCPFPAVHRTAYAGAALGQQHVTEQDTCHVHSKTSESFVEPPPCALVRIHRQWFWVGCAVYGQLEFMVCRKLLTISLPMADAVCLQPVSARL